MGRDGRAGGTGVRRLGGVLSADLEAIDWGFALYWGFAVIAFVAMCGALVVCYQLIREWRG